MEFVCFETLSILSNKQHATWNVRITKGSLTLNEISFFLLTSFSSSLSFECYHHEMSFRFSIQSSPLKWIDIDSKPTTWSHSCSCHQMLNAVNLKQIVILRDCTLMKRLFWKATGTVIVSVERLFKVGITCRITIE